MCSGSFAAGRWKLAGRRSEKEWVCLCLARAIVVASLPSAGGSCVLGREKAAHARARRLAAGDAIVLVDGSGAEAFGPLSPAVARDRVTIAIERVSHVPPEDLPAVHLCVAAVRPERLAWIAEKATELGASSLVLVVSERTQRPRAGAGLVPRLRRVVEEAAEQSERARWPAIDGPVAFSSALVDEVRRSPALSSRSARRAAFRRRFRSGTWLC